MPSLKDLRTRIKSVKSTEQITKTMKMVAAAKMRRAVEACEQSRPYSDALNKVLTELSSRIPKSGAPLMLRGRDKIKTVRLVIFGSNRGLCGGFNGQIARQALKTIRKWQEQGKKVQVVTVGSKAHNGMKSLCPELLVDRNDDLANKPEYSSAEALGIKITKAFDDANCDEVHILFNTFVNVMIQKPTFRQLLPFKADKNEGKSLKASADYEPSEEEILAHLLPLNVSTQIFSALLESQASEQGARMSAMDSASRNAGEMIKTLSLKYNRQRQANITKEITEIVSGAEAA